MKLFILIIVNTFLVGLFLYSKFLPYKDKLDGRFKGIFIFFNSVFSPVLNFLKRFIKPFQVGQGLAIDMTQVVLLILLLLLLNYL